MKIISNYHWRPFIFGYDVPGEVLADYDWLDDDDKWDGWLCYRGDWYHASDFISFNSAWASPGNPLAGLGWHGHFNDSAFSALVIELGEGENEGHYRIGLALS